MIERLSCAPALRSCLTRVTEWLGVDLSVGGQPVPAALRVSAERWQSEETSLLDLDHEVHLRDSESSPFVLHLAAESAREPRRFFEQVLTRYQRLLPFRQATSPGVERALPAHQSLFDLAKPLVRADFHHALDTWRWSLRLDLGASGALQLAALFHDVERLQSEPDERIEHLASDYEAFKRAHARGGARRAEDVLVGCGLPSEVVARTRELIERHEAPSSDEELATLNDADALSFFSLNSWGFVEYFGEAHTRLKIRYTLGRMRPAARRYLPRLRYHARVAGLLKEELPGSLGAQS